LEEYERLFERALRALDRERPARRVLRRLRDDVGQAVELLNTMERFDGETDDAQAQYIQALERFRKEVQTLPGLAEERLRLESDALAAAEPSLIEQGDPEPEFARRAFLDGIEQLPSIKVMPNARATPDNALGCPPGHRGSEPAVQPFLGHRGTASA